MTEVQPTENKSKTIIWVLIIGFFVSIPCIICAVVVVIIFEMYRTADVVQPNNNNIITTTVPITSVLTTSTPTLPTLSEGQITGALSYPSEYTPAMKLCAQDTTTQESFCVNTPENSTKYSIKVKPGAYYVYAEANGGYTAYYTNCDTDTPIECNNSDWSMANFVCYNDSACKLAYAPKKTAVVSNKTVTGINIMQGWYLPCNESECPSGLQSSPSWENYINWD